MLHSKFPILIALLCCLIACNQNSKQSDNSNACDTTITGRSNPIIADSTISTKENDIPVYNEAVESKIIDSIFTLSEVKERAKYIETQTEGKRHLKVWIADKPNLPDQKYYWIKVGEDNGTNLVTHFNFYAYPNPIRIMYYDISNDSELTLEEWRKTKLAGTK